MRTSKAIAGGVAGALTVVAMDLIQMLPLWPKFTDEAQGAIAFLVSAGICAAAVYVAPANRT